MPTQPCQRTTHDTEDGSMPPCATGYFLQSDRSGHPGRRRTRRCAWGPCRCNTWRARSFDALLLGERRHGFLSERERRSDTPGTHACHACLPVEAHTHIPPEHARPDSQQWPCEFPNLAANVTSPRKGQHLSCIKLCVVSINDLWPRKQEAR
jgi:hypothetical protein